MDRKEFFEKSLKFGLILPELRSEGNGQLRPSREAAICSVTTLRRPVPGQHLTREGPRSYAPAQIQSILPEWNHEI